MRYAVLMVLGALVWINLAGWFRVWSEERRRKRFLREFRASIARRASPTAGGSR
jgi:hypothetical protein